MLTFSVLWLREVPHVEGTSWSFAHLPRIPWRENRLPEVVPARARLLHVVHFQERHARVPARPGNDRRVRPRRQRREQCRVLRGRTRRSFPGRAGTRAWRSWKCTTCSRRARAGTTSGSRFSLQGIRGRWAKDQLVPSTCGTSRSQRTENVNINSHQKMHLNILHQ